MGTKTGIEWTDATWSPILGCSRVSEGCRNCYAERIAGRFPNSSVYGGLTQIVNGRAVWTGQIKETKKLLEPLSWKSPKRVFVNSMSDLFHENVSDELRDRIFAVMALCPQHTFQVLTKRPARMLKYLTGHFRVYSPGPRELAFTYVQKMRGYDPEHPKWIRVAANAFDVVPLPNVWLGVSVENQAAADERIPLLLQTPAAVRFISAEPLLGPVDLTSSCDVVMALNYDCPAVDGIGKWIDWVICGGESGPGARPMHPDWARSLRDQCLAAGVPFFFKQWGEWWPKKPEENLGLLHAGAKCHAWMPGGLSFWRFGKHDSGALLDGVEWKQFPEAK